MLLETTAIGISNTWYDNVTILFAGGGEDAGVAEQTVVVAHATGQDARPVAARMHAVVRGHGAGRVGHGQLHAVLLPNVAPRPAVLPERRAAGGRGVPGARVPGVPVAAVAVAAQPQLRDRLHTGGAVQRAGDVRTVAHVPEHRAGPRAQRHRRRRGLRHFRAVRHARVLGSQHVVLLPVPAARQPSRPRRRRVRRVDPRRPTGSTPPTTITTRPRCILGVHCGLNALSQFTVIFNSHRLITLFFRKNSVHHRYFVG